MKTVKVKDIGVQVNGISYFKNDVFQVTDEDYEPIKEFVDVLKEDENNTKGRVILIKVENEELNLKEIESYLYNCLHDFGKIPIVEIQNPEGEPKTLSDNDNNEGDDSGEDEELEALKERARKLNIKVTGNMKKETIIKKIEEAEKEAGEIQNPEGE